MKQMSGTTNFELIPSELKVLDQWVCFGWKGFGKPKAPFQPIGALAYIDRPETWSSFSACQKAVMAGKALGVGFVFSQHDPYVGIDVDNGIPDDWQSFFGSSFPGAYVEVSPSGKGMHIIVKGRIPRNRKFEKLKWQIDQVGRYLTFTGQTKSLPGSTIGDCQTGLDRLFEHIQMMDGPKRSEVSRPTTTSATCPDDALAAFVGKSSLGPQLYFGIPEKTDTVDASSVWFGLLCSVAKVTTDEDQAKRFLFSSGFVTNTYAPAGERSRLRKCERLWDSEWARALVETEEFRRSNVSRPLSAKIKRGSDHSDADDATVIVNCLPVGTTIISADPKTGKSWIALCAAWSIVTGQNFLQHHDFKVTAKGSALVFSLEDNEAGMKRRMDMLGIDEKSREKIHFGYDAEPIDGRLQATIKDWVREVGDAALIVVDMFDNVRTEMNRNETQNQHDLRDVNALNQLGDELGIAVLAVHHNRKAAAEGTKRASGTQKIAGTARTLWFLKKTPKGLVMDITGRQTPEGTFALHQDGFNFSIKPDATRLSDQMTAILEAAIRLEMANEVISNRNLFSQVDYDSSESSIRSQCSRLVGLGCLIRAERRGQLMINETHSSVVGIRKKLKGEKVPQLLS